MKTRDLTDLLLLAALWGASFLFMRIAAPAFGPFALVEVRVAVAAMFLGGLLALRGELRALREQPLQLAALGVLASALPFVLLTYATLHVTAGYAAILNATTPLWTALVGWLWLRNAVAPLQWLGMAIGLLGVAVLVWGKASFAPSASELGTTLALAAALVATFAYGVAANFSRRYLATTPPLVIAAGSQIAAAAVLLPPAALTWPQTLPPALAWVSAIALGIACTGLAYLVFFRLLARVGAVSASTVTFLIPVFATSWGALFLGEGVTAQMLAGGAVILAGTGLSLGLGPRRAAAPSSAAAAQRATGAPRRAPSIAHTDSPIASSMSPHRL
jgi:drug/metabolite transporter (DMT)-like permease